MKAPHADIKTGLKTPPSMPNVLLRLEGVVTLIAAVTAYVILGGNGWLFAALLFAPDLSMLGYTANPRIGSAIYNTIHILLLPAGALGLGLIFHSDLTVQLALIWLAHIGMDRALGFGLKYPTVFEDTHLQHV
jgi:hypothetical protein